MAFLFKDLTVYKKILERAGEVETLAAEFRGKVSSAFLDQLTRASLSSAIERNAISIYNSKKLPIDGALRE